MVQVVAQLNIIFAKVARFDYPVHWPTLFSDIFGLMTTSETLQYRIFLVLQQILKELSSKRLPADQKLMHEVIPNSKAANCCFRQCKFGAFLNLIDQRNSVVCSDHPGTDLAHKFSHCLVSRTFFTEPGSCFSHLFMKISQELFTPFWQQWSLDSQVIISAVASVNHFEGRSDDDPIIPALQRWILLGKVL